MVDAPPEDVYAVFSRLGGEQGWLYADGLWWLRGVADRLVGGPGFRRGRRDPDEVRVGDALDFWRVLEVDAPRRLLLLAEMKTPGEALLDIQIRTLSDNTTQLQLHSRFLPKGLGGILYWYTLYPFHQWVFRDMLKAIAKSIGKPMDSEPRRFTPKLPAVCELSQ